MVGPCHSMRYVIARVTECVMKLVAKQEQNRSVRGNIGAQSVTCWSLTRLTDMISCLPLLSFTGNPTTDQWKWLWSFCLGGTNMLFFKPNIHHVNHYRVWLFQQLTHYTITLFCSPLQYSRCLALAKPLQFSQKDIPKIRKRIYKELCDCKLHEQGWRVSYSRIYVSLIICAACD